MVAKKNDKKSNDWDINVGKILCGSKIPINIDFVKSGLGNNIRPITNPNIIEI